MSRNPGPPVKAAQTTFEVVEAVKELDGARLTDLVEHLEMPKSTVHDYLTTLVRLGYLARRDDEYRLSTWFLDLGGYARRQTELYRLGKPEVDRLASDTGEHANLLVEEHGLGVFCYTAKGDEAVRLDTYAGKRVHLQATAMGKAILAHTPSERVEEILDRHGLPAFTEHTITDRDALRDELSAVRDRGYAVDDQERVEGMRCVAAPVTDADDRALGAVSVSGPVTRMNGERFEREVPDAVRRTANVLEVNITHA